MVATLIGYGTAHTFHQRIGEISVSRLSEGIGYSALAPETG